MSKKDFIDKLYKERSDYNFDSQAETTACSLDKLSSDIYSESQRFVFELIQNADDAALKDSNEIHFDFYSNSLIVSHKGKSFDEADINGITLVGKGTKGSDTTKTGYKGIGFKSVFRESNRVTIISDGYSFRFDKTLIEESFNGIKMPWQIIPIWTEDNDLHNNINISSLKDKFNVSTIIELKNSLSFKNELNELLDNGKILLFLRRITKVSISSNGILDYSIEKQIQKEKSYNEVKLLKNDIELSSWIVKTFDKIPIDDETQIALNQDDKAPDKLKEAKFTEISFAANIENGKLKEIKGEESLIFTYLPTKVTDFEFPFLVNGSFFTNAGREGIHEDSVWNKWLFKLIAEKTFDWFALLSQSKYKFQILHLLPNKFNNTKNKLKLSFDKSFDLYGKTKCFILNKSSQLKKAPEILIDETGLSEQDFIPTDAIIKYINRETRKTYTNSSFVHPDLESKHKLNSLGAYTFDLENLEDFFIDEIFIKIHKATENFKLINFLFKYVNNLRTNVEKNRWEEKLKSICFIKDEEEVLRNPSEIYLPSIQYSNEFSNEIYFINNVVLKDIVLNKEIKEWLIKLGVDEQTDIAFIEKTIIDNPSFVNIDNAIDVGRYLYKSFKNGILKESHFEELHNLKLLTTRGTLIAAENLYLSNFYKPDFQLEGLHDYDIFISSDYPDIGDSVNLWKELLLNIGTNEKIDWTVNSFDARETNDKEKFDYKYFDQKRGLPNYDYPNKIEKYYVNKISYIENCIDNYKFSLTFWNYVFNNKIELKRDKDKCWTWYFKTSTLDDIQPYFDFMIENCSLLPTTFKECRKINEIFLYSQEIMKIGNKFLPILDYDRELPDVWRDYFIEKKIKLALRLSDYLKILTSISEDIDNIQENKERILLIYKKLSENYLSNESELAEWGKENKLLSVNDEFVEISKLKYITVGGFIYNDLIFTDPKDDTPELIQLLGIWGITIINEIQPEISEKIADTTLKIQLQLILPYLIAIIERKHFVNYSAEFIRLSNLIDKTEFFKASEIILSFKNQDDIILGPSLHAYLDNSELTFKDKWTSPLTLYALIPELLKLFKLSGLSDELMLLIQLDENDIKQWFVEQGYELKYIQEKPEYDTAIEKVKSYTTEEDIEQSFDLVDNSDEKSRISINQDAKDNIFEALKREGFIVPDTLDINYTIVKGIKNSKEIPVKIVVKSGKAGKLYFNPSEWLALTEADTQLFVVTRGNIVRNITLNDLSAINDIFHMRFNTQAFAVNTNLKAFANFFRYLPYTHFIFDTPESITDFLEQFGLSERNPSSKELTSDDKNLLH